METSQCGLWTCLDTFISFYGHRFVSRRSWRRRNSTWRGVGFLSSSITSQLDLDTGFLRSSSTGSCKFFKQNKKMILFSSISSLDFKSIVIILALFVNIFICILQFWQINTYAGMLMIPYLVWVGFGKFSIFRRCSEEIHHRSFSFSFEHFHLAIEFTLCTTTTTSSTTGSRS